MKNKLDTIPVFSFKEMMLMTFLDISPNSSEEIWKKPILNPGEEDLSISIPKYTIWQQILGYFDVED